MRSSGTSFLAILILKAAQPKTIYDGFSAQTHDVPQTPICNVLGDRRGARDVRRLSAELRAGMLDYEPHG